VILVTDPVYPLPHVLETVRVVALALGPGRLAVMLRDHHGDMLRYAEQCRALREVSAAHQALLLVNGPSAPDDTYGALDVARALGADGFHLRSRSQGPEDTFPIEVALVRGLLGEHAFVTAPAHDDEAVRRAARAGIDAVLVSPVFTSPGKGPPRGVEALTAASRIAAALAPRVPSPRRTRLLVYALGGVDAERAASCAGAGADGVALIRALLSAERPDLAAVALAAPFTSQSP